MNNSHESSTNDLGWALHDRPDLWIVPGRAVREGDVVFRSVSGERVSMGDAVSVSRVVMRGNHGCSVFVDAGDVRAFDLHVDEPVLVQRAPWLTVAMIAEQNRVEIQDVERALLALGMVESRAHSRVEAGVRVYSPSLVKSAAHALTSARRDWLRHEGATIVSCAIADVDVYTYQFECATTMRMVVQASATVSSTLGWHSRLSLWLDNVAVFVTCPDSSHATTLPLAWSAHVEPGLHTIRLSLASVEDPAVRGSDRDLGGSSLRLTVTTRGDTVTDHA